MSSPSTRPASAGTESPFARIGAADLGEHVLDLRWDRTGEHLAALPSSGPARILDARGSILALRKAPSSGNGAFAWLPDGSGLVTAGIEGEVVRHASGGGEVWCRNVGPDWTEALAASPDGRRVAVTSGTTLVVLDAADGSPIERIEGAPHTLSGVAWNPRRPDEWVIAEAGGIRVGRVGRTSRRIPWSGVSRIPTWSPDGRWVATADASSTVHVVDVALERPLDIGGLDGRPRDLAWSADGTLLAIADAGGISVWDCSGRSGPEGREPRLLHGHLRGARTVDYCPALPILASGGAAGEVFVWLPGLDSEPRPVALLPEPVSVVRWSPDGRCIALGTAGGSVFLHRLPDRRR